MIERISGLGIAPVTAGLGRSGSADDVGSTVAGIAATAMQGTGVPLRALAESGAARIAEARGVGSPVTIGQLQRDTLDFAREAKALAIGNPERTADELTARIDDAIAAGREAAAALPTIGGEKLPNDDVMLRTAAQHLATGFEAGQ